MKLFKQLFLFLFTCFLFDRGLGWTLKKLLIAEPQGASNITSYGILKSDEDVLIYGSSRASHHYISKLIKDSLQLSTFNLGRDGMSILYDNIMYKAALGRYKPKVVILDLNPNELTWKAGQEGIDEATSVLLPYVNINKVVKENLDSINRLATLKAQVVHSYCFNSLPFSLLQHYFKIGEKDQFGYLKLVGSGVSNSEIVNSSIKDSVGCDSLLTNNLKEFISLSRDNGINLHVFISPKYNNFDTLSRSFEEIKKICIENDIPFHNLIGYKNGDRSLFYDAEHLNNSGARLYTEKTIAILKGDAAFVIGG